MKTNKRHESNDSAPGGALMALPLIFWTSVLGGGLVFCVTKDLLDVMPAIVWGGAIGALFSQMRILSKAPVSKSKLFRWLYPLFLALVGAMCAGVLYLFFATNLIPWSGFPHFYLSKTDPNLNPFVNFACYWQPKDPPDFAKMAFWGFLAGFSERLIPNLLQLMVGRATAAIEKFLAPRKSITGPEGISGTDLSASPASP